MSAIHDNLLHLLESFDITLNAKEVDQAPDKGANMVSALESAIRASGKFDCQLYLESNPDVKAAGMDPVEHYVSHGYGEKRPFPLRAVEKAKKKSLIFRQGGLGSLYDNPLQVNWGVTTMCNYKCSYCFGQAPLDKKNFLPISKFMTAVDNLKAMNRPSYMLAFSGGEPTTQPGFYDFLAYLDEQLGEKINYVIIVTNGSRQMNLYNNLATLSESMNLDLKISLHLEFLDISHIITIVEDLANKAFLRFNFMFLPTARKKAELLFSILCQLRQHFPFSLNIELLRKPPTYSELIDQYSHDDLEWRREATAEFDQIAQNSAYKISPKRRFYGNKLFWDYKTGEGRRVFQAGCEDRTKYFKEGMFCFKDMYCAFGTSLLNIFSNGIISGGVCNLAPKGGNIFEPGMNINADFIKLVKCGNANCGCEANDPMMKFRDKTEAEEYVANYKVRLFR